MKMKLNIPVILGTAREEADSIRQTEKVAKYVMENTQKISVFDSEFVDVKDYALSRTDRTSELAFKWQAFATAADGFIFVSPEYNRSYPGELKMFLDQAYMEYKRKVAGFVCTSNGYFGGARVSESLKQLSSTLNMASFNTNVYVPDVEKSFTEEGPVDSRFDKSANKMFEELNWWASSLKYGREQLT